MNSDLLAIDRTLSLKDSSPFLVIQDSFAQPSRSLLKEILHRSNGQVAYLGFESASKPAFLKEHDLFLDCLAEHDLETSRGLQQVAAEINKFAQKSGSDIAKPKQEQVSIGTIVGQKVVAAGQSEQGSKVIVVIDSLNYIKTENVSKIVTALRPNANSCIIGVNHLSVLEEFENVHQIYPKKQDLLNYIATSIFDVKECLDEDINTKYYNRLLLPTGLSHDIFAVKLYKSKKSGRRMEFEFEIDCNTHKVSLLNQKQKSSQNENDLLHDLSTFNLSTTSKQKLAKSEVELPFMEAQNFENGGAIVYQFEKDDDYDEEDPFEDPF